jgi:hypothetical protein
LSVDLVMTWILVKVHALQASKTCIISADP